MTLRQSRTPLAQSRTTVKNNSHGHFFPIIVKLRSDTLGIEKNSLLRHLNKKIFN